MIARTKKNQLKRGFSLALIVFLIIQISLSHAQSRSVAKYHRGFDVSFGARSLAFSSDIAKIDGTNPMPTGGQLGVVFGTQLVRSKLGLFGYYSSTGNTAGTTDLYTSNVAANCYPLSAIVAKEFLLNPYFTGGFSYDRFKLFGFYINQEPETTNYSRGEAPFLGKIREMNASAGLGMECRLRDDGNFIHLFAELRFVKNLSRKLPGLAFEQTTINDQAHLSVGFSFGAN